MEKYYIYKFTNKINGMSYIGQSINPKKRYREHFYKSKNIKKIPYFDRVARKYGQKNFTFEIIDSANNIEKTDQLEQYYIQKFNTIKPNGYNILKGGRTQKGAWNSKPINEFDLDGNYINTYESASYYYNFINKSYKREGINRSCNLKTKYKERQFRYFGDEYPNKFIPSKSNHKTKVYQFDLDGNLIKEYETLKTASEETNTCRTTISGCIKGIYKTAGGFVWSKNKNINIFEINPKYINKTNIYKCDKNKNILEKYNNSKEAEIKNNFKHNSYKMILKKLDTNKPYMGYYWYRVKTFEDNTVPNLEIGRCNDYSERK